MGNNKKRHLEPSSNSGQTSNMLPVKNFHFSSTNVFARMQSGQMLVDFIFNRPHTFAILDARPVSSGHSLLVVKHPVATVLDSLPDPAAPGAIFSDLQVLAKAVQQATGCPGVTIRQHNGPVAGQTVPQLHFHVIPNYTGPDLQASPDALEDRPLLKPEDAGPLLARICNALPSTHSSGVYAWVPTSEAMEELGESLQQAFCSPGTVVYLQGQLGSGKSTLSRGFIRAFCQDQHLDVPSPTFLLCLTYRPDTAYSAANNATSAAPAAESGSTDATATGGESSAAAEASGPSASTSVEQQDASTSAPSAAPMAVHHMDPYRLGQKADKIAGLIDFDQALSKDVCLIEWPDRMPKSVRDLVRSALVVQIHGTGIQGAGRLIHLSTLQPTQTPSKATAAASDAGTAPSPAEIPASTTVPLTAQHEEVLSKWRASGIPPSQVAWQKQRAANHLANGSGTTWSAPQLAGTDPSSWLVLGIESSCDDTAAAVVRGDGEVLGHCIASQTGLHEQYGGVKPDVARDAHAQAIGSTVERCLASAGVSSSQLSAVAVTVGPGLSLCLQVGVRHALSLAMQHQLPVVPVHHMEAHTLMTRLPSLNPQPMAFPALVLLVSGGHNMLVHCEGVGQHRIIGTTLDDSVGECFDKTARLLGISSIPGGPLLEQMAATGNPKACQLPIPMKSGAHKDSCNFSFSGIKTSVAKLVEAKRAELGLKAPPSCPFAAAEAAAAAAAAAGSAGGDAPMADAGAAGGSDAAAGTEAAEAEFRRFAADVAASFQATSVTFLQQRARRALGWLRQDAEELGKPFVTTLVVAGGVAANKAVRAGLEAVAKEFGIACVCPPIKYCTDNGLMVAWTGVERLRLGLYNRPPAYAAAVEANVQVLPRWPIGPMDPRSEVSKGCGSCKMFN